MIPEHKKLNMGCGFKKLNNFWNVDFNKNCNPDEIVDFEHTPFPWEDNYFEEIIADNCIEHLGQTPKKFGEIIKEMYRISSNQCIWTIIVPHHRCDNYWDDFTHVRTITENTFRHFDRKINLENLKNNIGASTHGLNYDIDLEVIDVKYDITYPFRNKLESGIIGNTQLNIDLNTMNNVAERVTIFIKVHKPFRYKNWIL